MSPLSRVSPDEAGSIVKSGFAPLFVIGTIESAIGRCTLARPGSPTVQIRRGDGICEGDVIETPDDGSICIRLTDGTVLNLSGNASMRLSEFADVGTAPSALLHVARGGLAFVAGAIAKTGQFAIETPLASMRRRARSDGLGFLSFAGLLFAAMEEVHAASSGVAFLDDGTIAYKDLEHGIFELVTKEANPRHIFVDDPGETIVLRRVGSSISESHVTNSVAQMAQFEAAQQEALHIFSLGLQGPTATGAGGSSSPPPFTLPSFVQPINFTQPDDLAPQLAIPDNGPGAGGHSSTPFDLFFIPPAPATPPGTVVERVNVTGDTALDSTTGTLALNGGSFSKSAPTFVWSGGDLTADQVSTLAAASALTVTPSGAGTANVSFSAPDNVFDFLAAGETLKITYKVTDSGGNHASVTITIVGTNDAPELAADASGTYQISELVCHTNDSAPDTVTGSLHFGDPDLNDTHTAAATIASIDWSGSGPLPDGLEGVLANALSLTEIDSSGSGDGSVGFKFCAADNNFDFLADGETLTVTYDVSVTDNHGVSAIQPVTITITGSNDAPMLAADCSGTHVITERAGMTGDAADLDTSSGTLHFSDADLDDTHCVTSHLCSVTTSGGCALPDGLTEVLANALVLTEDDSTGSASGTVDFQFAAADENFDFLAAGQTLTVVYDVTVADGHGGSSTKPVTITISGTNDAPVLQLTGAYTLDQFTTHDYGAWAEQNDDGFGATNGSPTQGDFQIAHDAATAPGDLQIRLTDLDAEVGVPDLLSRTVDLSGATSATLTFDYRRDIPHGDADDKFCVLASSDGVNFTEIGQIGATGNGSFVDGAYQIFTFDLTPYISTHTTIRFSVGDNVDNGDIVYVDNFQVSYTAAAPADDFSVNYTENSAVGVAGQITDVDSKAIYSAAITLVNHQDSDLLAVAGKLPDGIVSSGYDAAHGVLMLTGSASLSAYETALQQVVFSNSSDSPDSADRTLAITVNDGHDDSNIATTTIHVTPIDDAPVTMDDHVITNLDFHTQFEIPEFALIANDSDADNSLDQLSVTSVGHAFSGSAMLQSGTVSFTDTGFFPGGSFDYTVSDGALDATGHVTVSEAWFGALNGTNQSDILIGKPGGSTINGKGGNDVLIGNAGADILNGGGGADAMSGGGGNDSFVFKVVTDSLPGSGHFDTITDFIHGADHIDLSAIAGVNSAQGQVLTPNTVDAHHVSWFVDEAHDETILYVDAGNTPNHVDMEIHLAGANLHVSNTDILIHV